MELPSRIRFGDFELDPAAFRLSRHGSPVPVEPKALDLLLVLLERAPRVVDKREIFSLVWKDVAVTDNALTRLVAQLRKALGDDPKMPRYIETVATRGYRFVAGITVPGLDKLDEAPVTSAPAVPALPTGRPRSMRRWLAIAAIGVALLWTAAWLAVRSTTDRVTSSVAARETGTPDVEAFASLRPQQVTAGTGYDGFLAFAPDGRSIAYSSDRSGSFEIYVQGVAEGSTVTALTNNRRHNIRPAWSPDGQFIAYQEMAGSGIWVVPSRGGVPRKVSDFGGDPVWSPDGGRLAFHSLPTSDINPLLVPGALSTIWLVDSTGRGEPVAVTTPGHPAGPHVTPAWGRDSRHLFFVVPVGAKEGSVTSLWRVDVEEGRLRQVTSHDRLTPEYVVTPDGRGIYFVARGTNSIWWLSFADDGDTAREPHPTGLPAIGSMIAQLAISADGRQIAWTALDASGHVWATTTGGGGSAGATPLTEGGGVRYSLPASSIDGRLALIGSRPGSFNSIFLLAAGAPLRQLTAHPPHHGGPRWMPGEREIAFLTDHGDGPGFWAIDLETGRERRLFLLSELKLPADSQPSTAAPATNIAITPDFRRLTMSVVRDGIPNLWTVDLRESRPAGSLVQRTFEREGASYPSWSMDGRWIAYQCSADTHTHVCVTGAETGERLQLTHDPGQSWVGGWMDSDTVLFAARRDAVWNVAAVSRLKGEVRMLTRFTEPRTYVRYPRWDPAHRRVVFERSETIGRLWSVQLPEPTTQSTRRTR